MEGMLDSTGDNIFTFYDFPKEIKTAIYTSNAIESFNSKLKRDTRKRILMNSEKNAAIIITHICKSYNNSSGTRLLTGLNKVDATTRHTLGFNF